MARPKVNSESEKELDRAEQQFKTFDEQVKDMTLDRMNQAPLLEREQQTKLSSKDIEKAKDIYLKPVRMIHSREKFNEDYRKDYDFAKEYVHFTAENNEIIGEDIELWTKPFAGMPAEMWRIPVNKPVWGPRYLAEQLKKCTYHRLIMENRPVSSDSSGQYFGAMAADKTIKRIDAHPVSSRKSVFMGATSF